LGETSTRKKGEELGKIGLHIESRVTGVRAISSGLRKRIERELTGGEDNQEEKGENVGGQELAFNVPVHATKYRQATSTGGEKI